MRAAVAGIALVVMAVPATGVAGTCAGPADLRAGARAADWLAGRAPAGLPVGQLADSVSGLRASGRSRAALASRVALLRTRGPAYSRTAGASGKVALAAIAAGADPSRFGGVDYIGRIRGAYADGRFGVTAYDQALAMLALAGAGERVPPAAVAALRRARGAGGWGFDLRPSRPDQVDATATVLEALAAAGVVAPDPAVRGALAWMLAQRGADGGVASAGGGRPADANSTAMAWRALCAQRHAVPPTLRAALRRLQAADGRVRFSAASEGSTLLATAEAVTALRGATLPVGAAPTG